MKRISRRFVPISDYIGSEEPVKLEQRTVRAHGLAQSMLSQSPSKSPSQHGVQKANQTTTGRQQRFNGGVRMPLAGDQIDDRSEFGRTRGAVERSRNAERKGWQEVERQGRADGSQNTENNVRGCTAQSPLDLAANIQLPLPDLKRSY